MSQYSAIKAAVNAYIKANGRKEITGNILNAVLNATISSLGKFYQFAGVALPSTDPEDPDQNVCYLAGEPGTYVHFDNNVLENEEIALLFWNGEWTKQRMLLGIQEVEATVDNQVGTPSVDVSYSAGRLVLTFHNLKGETGNTGAAAGFGTIGADITGGVGTPGVSVESSGSDTAKNLMFHFTNLKGETGVTSVIATVDNTTGTPQCSVSLVGGVLTLAFTGLKGLQGDTGVSADYPITIVNNLTTNDPTSALSAAQGVQLESEISQLEAKVIGEDIPVTESGKAIYLNGGVGSTIPAPTNSSYSYSRYSVTPGDVVIVNGTGGSSPRLWGFIDSSEKIIAVSDASVSASELVLLVPENAAEVIINTNDTSIPSRYVSSNYVLELLADMRATIAQLGEDFQGEVDGLQAQIDAIIDVLYPVLENEIATDSTIEGKYISNTGNATDFSSYDILLYDLTDVDKVRITVTSASTSLRLYGFYSSDQVSSGNLVGTIGPVPSSSSFDETVSVPEGAAYLAVTSYKGHQTTTVKAVSRGDALDNLQDQIDEINGELTYTDNVLVPIDQTMSQKYIKANGSIADFSTYDVYVYDVQDISTVKVTATGAANAPTSVAAYGFYSDTPAAGTLVQVGPGSTSTFDYTANVPSGAKYLACTFQTGVQSLSVSVPTVKNKLDEMSVPPVKYTIQGQTIYLASQYRDYDLVVRLAPFDNGNNLFDFRKIYKQAHSNSINTTALTDLLGNSSDWFAPYQILAKTNIDGDDTGNTTFTGGAHQYNNLTSGSTKTARMSSLKFYIDNEEKSSGSGFANIVKMKWTNYVQATNTKKADGTGREVLTETITLTFDGRKWEAFNDIVPLEDITVHLYYGYQFGGIGSAFDHWRFVNAENRGDDAANSGNKDTKAILASGTSLNLGLWLDNEIDLGKRIFCTSGTTTGAFRSSGKCYFTIANNDGTLVEDSHYYMRGEYTIELV